MTIFLHEMKQGIRTLAIWSIVVGAMVFLCMALYPSMGTQTGELDALFANMGSFTAAFGLDRISMTDPMGFYGIEGGNVLGIGGALFAAYLGVRMLAKEEGDHTAEFLLVHPVSRAGVVAGKLVALVAEVAVFNVVCVVLAVASFMFIGEDIEIDAFWLFHLAQFILQVEIACICFAASAFVRHGGIGAGLGFAALLYFMNIIASISEDVEAFRYVTPFAYADPATVLTDGALDGTLVAIGLAITVAAILVAFVRYTRKDIVA